MEEKNSTREKLQNEVGSGAQEHRSAGISSCLDDKRLVPDPQDLILGAVWARGDVPLTQCSWAVGVGRAER